LFGADGIPPQYIPHALNADIAIVRIPRKPEPAPF